jgi:thiamine biosynthesis lipoprotein
MRRGYEGVVVDTTASTVLLPPGVGFDPGGIGKGYAADLVVAEMLALGAAGACVSVGGDLRAEGEGIGGAGWKVAVEHPMDEDPAALIALASGAVATSSSVRRAWGPNGHRRHHLIDPSTGLPARTGVLSTTAIAAEAWRAEVLAKAAFVSGVTGGLALLSSVGADGLVVDADGAVHATPGLGSFTRGVGAVEGGPPLTAETIRR